MNMATKEYKICKTCRENKHHSEYYIYKGIYVFPNCKACTSKKDKENHKKEVEKKGGSEFVHSTPGVFACPIQKENTFKILKSLGYQLNEEKNIWWKPGVKEIVDNKPVFLLHRKGPGKDKLKQIMKVLDLHKSGMNGKKIATKTNLSATTVYKIIRENEESHKDSRSSNS